MTAGVETPPVTGLDAAKVRIIALEDEVRRLKRELAARGPVVAVDGREAVAGLFEGFVRDPAVRQALGRVPWGGFRDRVLAAVGG